MIDITDRKQVEENITVSQKLLQRIIDLLPIRIFWKDKNLIYLGCNEMFAKDAGQNSPKDLIGKDDFQMVWKEQAILYQDDDRSVIESGKSKFNYEEQQTTPGGNKILLKTSKVPLIDLQGNTIGILGTYEDITERKRAEEALLVNIERYLLAQAVGHVGSWEYNLQTTQFWGSDEAKRIYGFDPKQTDFSTDEVESCIPERNRVHQALIDLIEKGKAYNLEFEIHPKNSTESRFITSIAKLHQDKHGAISLVVGVIQDITERKRVEMEKTKLETQLQQSQKMESIGRLAGGVAHDFNNMLTVILGHVEMALDQIDPKHPLYIDLMEIHKSAERSSGLTRQLLAFARKQTITPKVLYLNETISGMLNMLQRLIGEDVDLHWQPASSLWQIRMDPSQIDQLLANLCVNARDAIKDVGKITIETQNNTFDQDYCTSHPGFIPGEYVSLTVSDTGIGMEKETISHIFEPFFTTKELGKGTGLGLATVYGIVRQNNGFINVISEPGQGTTLNIYLPRFKGIVEQVQPEDTERPIQRGQETILLVEDEPAILKLTTRMLSGQGYTVLATNSPGEAIRVAREHAGEINLLMTDVIMPEMNGKDLAKNLLSHYPNLKQLFMSGYTADVIAHHGVLDEGVYFIQKPFSIKDLSAKVRDALNSE